ncbi:MAG: polysaccharide deacetylase family protein [Verrucomicrobiota bacterium]
MTAKILLSFDLEEFDLPIEYGCDISQEQQFEISRQGLENIEQLLNELRIPATFFTTAVFAEHFPEKIRVLSQKHEIASHGEKHSAWDDDVPARSKQTIEKILRNPIAGFRRARLQNVDYAALQKAGYRYDSSLHPTWIPTRYNHFFAPRTMRHVKDMIEIPVSVTPLIRFPLFWLSFKNFPLPVIKLFSIWTLRRDGYLNLFFHPWEFADLSAFALPRYIKHPDNGVLLDRLKRYLEFLKPHGEYITFSQFLLLCRNTAS